MTFTGPLYDRMKFIAQIVLPALATLYLTLGALWDLPKPQEVAATIVALDTFLGVCLQLSSTAFKKESALVGDMIVGQNAAGGTVHTLAINTEHELEDLENKKEVRFKVVKQPVKKSTPRRRKIDQEDGLTLVELVIAGAFVLALLAVLIAAHVI